MGTLLNKNIMIIIRYGNEKNSIKIGVYQVRLVAVDQRRIITKLNNYYNAIYELKYEMIKIIIIEYPF